MREYLIYKMRESNISREEICKVIHVSEKTLRNKLSGRTDFTWRECRTIRKRYFPNEEYESLFENSTPLENGA